MGLLRACESAAGLGGGGDYGCYKVAAKVRISR